MESISVNYRDGCYRKAKGLRLRPVPELKACCVFTPWEPRLYWLNLNAWLALELCDGATWTSIEVGYLDATCPPMLPRRARAQLRATLEDFMAAGLVERPESPAQEL